MPLKPPIVRRVLLVDDDVDMLHATRQCLEIVGWEVQGYENPTEALSMINSDFNGVVITDIRMPQLDGRQLFKRIRKIDPEIPTIFITGHGDVAEAVEAMQEGAYNFIMKPFSSERILAVVAQAATVRQTALERRQIRALAQSAKNEWPIMGHSDSMVALRALIRQVAEADMDTIIVGETGVGKELVARALHAWGPRSKRTFVAVNCGALSPATVDSELFGHELGAFPGAVRSRVGRAEFADRGVLFLDEIEATPLETQIKLLRFLGEREVVPLGANEPRNVDVRVLVSTKLDLSAPDNIACIRPDLFHRLNVAQILVPPLRERRSDVPLLFSHFAVRAAERSGLPTPPISDAVRRKLIGYDWPGNVRELAHFAERFAFGLENESTPEVKEGSPDDGLKGKIDKYEVELICDALTKNSGDVQKTLNELMLPRKTFYDKINKYKIDINRFRLQKGV
jgi:two-component system, NtrC family, C4-dicarboxylate transport response regulator DctD